MPWLVAVAWFQPLARALELDVVRETDGATVLILENGKPVFSPIEAHAGVVAMLPGARVPVRYRAATRENGVVTLRGGTAPGRSAPSIRTWSNGW